MLANVDPDDPQIVFTAELVTGLSPASAGTLTLNADGSFTFSPALNFNGSVSFKYRARSGSIVTNTATVSISVTAVNDPPTISNIPDQTTYQNGMVGPIAFTIGDVESPETLSVSASSNNITLVPNANIVLGGTGANRTVTVTPVANRTGTATITLLVTDGTGGQATDTFVLTVQPPPTLVGIQNVPPAVVKVTNTGSAVPMVWQYNVGSTAVDSSFVHHRVTVTGPMSVVFNDTDPGSSSFRYDPVSRRWSFNLQTKSASGQNYPVGTYRVTITPLTSGFVGTSFDSQAEVIVSPAGSMPTRPAHSLEDTSGQSGRPRRNGRRASLSRFQGGDHRQGCGRRTLTCATDLAGLDCYCVAIRFRTSATAASSVERPRMSRYAR